ncbi:MAG: biotin transporter BioY [Verrucomicrobia bacterium]|nr:biotin transporter BioY [Verrucomicrobiota bacterium]
MNYSYLVRETADDRSWLKEAAVILGASIIIALFAPISIRLPFTPVPIATQAHVILLLSCLLGSKRASMAVMTYLFQGAIGLPVFAGGAAGIAILAGPTGGYLLGYLAAAFVTGYIAERTLERTPSKAFAAMGVGNLVVYLFGLPWLAGYIGLQKAVVLGMLPFLIGDMLKLVIATKSLKGLRFYS